MGGVDRRDGLKIRQQADAKQNGPQMTQMPQM
jgi:hypothetical protein